MKKNLLVFSIIVFVCAGCKWSKPANKPVENFNSPDSVATTTSAGSPVKSECTVFKDLGITFTCPKDYYIVRYESKGSIYKNLVGLEIYEKNNPIIIEDSLLPNLFIDIFDDTFNGSLDKFIQFTHQCPAKRTGDTLIGGETAHIVVNKQMYECGSQEVVFINKKVYTFFEGNLTKKFPIKSPIIQSVKFYDIAK